MLFIFYTFTNELKTHYATLLNENASPLQKFTSSMELYVNPTASDKMKTFAYSKFPFKDETNQIILDFFCKIAFPALTTESTRTILKQICPGYLPWLTSRTSLLTSQDSLVDEHKTFAQLSQMEKIARLCEDYTATFIGQETWTQKTNKMVRIWSLHEAAHLPNHWKDFFIGYALLSQDDFVWTLAIQHFAQEHNFDEAEHHYTQFIDKTLENSELKVAAYANLLGILLRKNKLEIFEMYAKKALDEKNLKTKNYKHLIIIYTNVSGFHIMKHEYNKALEYAELAKKTAQKINIKEFDLSIQAQLGKIHFYLGSLKKAKSILLKLKQQYASPYTNYFLQEIYFKKKNYQEAKNTLELILRQRADKNAKDEISLPFPSTDQALQERLRFLNKQLSLIAQEPSQDTTTLRPFYEELSTSTASKEDKFKACMELYTHKNATDMSRAYAIKAFPFLEDPLNLDLLDLFCEIILPSNDDDHLKKLFFENFPHYLQNISSNQTINFSMQNFPMFYCLKQYEDYSLNGTQKNRGIAGLIPIPELPEHWKDFFISYTLAQNEPLAYMAQIHTLKKSYSPNAFLNLSDSSNATKYKDLKEAYEKTIKLFETTDLKENEDFYTSTLLNYGFFLFEHLTSAASSFACGTIRLVSIGDVNEQAKYSFEKVIRKSQEFTDNKLSAYQGLLQILLHEKNYEECIPYLTTVLEHAPEIEQKKHKSLLVVYNVAGVIAQNYYKYPHAALIMYERGYQYAQRLEHKEQQASFAHLLGTAHLLLGIETKAIIEKYLMEASDSGIAASSINLGTFYLINGNVKAARKYYKKALEQKQTFSEHSLAERNLKLLEIDRLLDSDETSDDDDQTNDLLDSIYDEVIEPEGEEATTTWSAQKRHVPSYQEQLKTLRDPKNKSKARDTIRKKVSTEVFTPPKAIPNNMYSIAQEIFGTATSRSPNISFAQFDQFLQTLGGSCKLSGAKYEANLPYKNDAAKITKRFFDKKHGSRDDKDSLCFDIRYDRRFIKCLLEEAGYYDISNFTSNT